MSQSPVQRALWMKRRRLHTQLDVARAGGDCWVLLEVVHQPTPLPLGRLPSEAVIPNVIDRATTSECGAENNIMDCRRVHQVGNGSTELN